MYKFEFSDFWVLLIHDFLVKIRFWVVIFFNASTFCAIIDTFLWKVEVF